jgi:hypothetical protein
MDIFSNPYFMILVPLGLSLLGGYLGALLRRKSVFGRLRERIFSGR